MNSNDYEKRFGMKLKDAYMKETVGELMSRDEFHRLIKKAERVTKKRRVLTGVAAAGVALCLIFGGFVAGMSMRESASAGKDDETKTLQQGNGVVIGSGISENDQNVGVSTKTYTNIDDIPEDIRKEIHFLDSDEFKLEKVKIISDSGCTSIDMEYIGKGQEELLINQKNYAERGNSAHILLNKEKIGESNDVDIYREYCDEGEIICFIKDDVFYDILFENTVSDEKKEVVLDDLIS